MKRLLTSAVLFLCCAATAFAQFTGSGSGTENDPYLITNPIQLNQLRNYLNTDNVYFKLMADVDLTDYLEDESPSQGWQPVGNSSSAAFKGILDGNGKTISGLWINRSRNDYVGFFGYLKSAKIKNLKILNGEAHGNNRVGLIAGYANSSELFNCDLSGTVSGCEYVGGCIGQSYKGNSEGQVSSIKVNGVNYVGGLFGYWETDIKSVIKDCSSNGIVEGTDYVGGVCGYSEFIDFKHCTFIGNIKANSYVGGLGGYTKGGAIGIVDACVSLGDVVAQGNNVGGLIGYSYNNNNSNQCVSNCYFSGMVKGHENVGGLIGFKDYGTITHCYSLASISGYKSVGGLCGMIQGTSKGAEAKCFANVIISSSIKAEDGNVGRCYGSLKYTVKFGEVGNTKEENKSYNRTIVISKGAAQEISDGLQNGIGVSASTLKLKATYVAMDWDFNDIWAIQETECYPYFKTQTAPPVITSQVVSGATTISGKCIDGETITLEVDGVKQQMVSTGNTFLFTVSPLQAGHEVRVSAKADGKEQSYYTTETVQYLGKGTETDPYQVYTAADLTGVYRKGYFKLMNDIDLTDYINQFSPTKGWESIGRDGSETIHFDGNGHKITGLWCNSPRDNTGLFSCFANGTIKDLTVETAKNKQVKGGANTGILIGKMINGTIENCKVSGAVADGTPVGGMVGLFDGGSISRCQANVTVATTGATSYVGGLVGGITGGMIDQCATQGTLKATGATSYVGGLIGLNRATVTNCYSTATITSSYNAAGLVAYNYGVVDMCYAIGDLHSNNYAAGVIGYNDGANAVVRNSVAMNNKIDVTYESQQVQQGGGYGQRIIGGIKNNAPAPEMNNYALKTMQVSLNDVPQIVYDDIMNGTAMTAAELKQKATYQELNWDFDNVWNIDEGTSYPYQTIKADTGTDPDDPGSDDPDDPDDPQGEVEVTDISTTDNVIYIEPMEELCGTQATISLKMKNSAAIRGFQFDLYLPQGVTVVKSSKNKIQGALSEGRLPEEDEHQLTFSEQPDGAIRFLCSSQYDETFTGNDGEIATLQVNIGEEMTDGDYAIDLKNVKLTETDISKYYLTDLVRSKLTVKTYLLGDINNDNLIDVSDYTGVANHIHGNTPEGFNMRAADVDESGNIDVSDYTGIANIIHTGSIYGNSNPQGAPRMLKRANTNVDSYDNVIYITPFSAQAGEQVTVSLKMKNTADIRGFQFDLYLPEGVTVAKSNKGRIQGALSAGRLPDEDEHELTFSEQPDGAIRFLCSSQYDETFTGNDGELATLKVNIAEGIAAGDHPILLKNMKLTETDISKYYTAKLIESTLTVTGTSGIGLTPDPSPMGEGNYYTLDGQKLNGKPTQKGLYIQNERKIIVK